MVFCFEDFCVLIIFCKMLCCVFDDLVWEICIDYVFCEMMVVCVIIVCFGQYGMWIIEDVIQVYIVLYCCGYVYSVEMWYVG